MWPVLTVSLLVTLAVLHLGWRRRLGTVRQALDAEIARLRLAQQQAESEAQSQQEALLNSVAAGLLVLDSESRIRLANRAFADLFGVAGQVRGKTVIEVVRAHALADLCQRAQSQEGVLGLEFHMPGPPERWLQVNAAAIPGPNGQRTGVVMVFYDITRLRNLEKVRQDFVANVSHELRTPLSHIKGYTETLLGGAKDDPQVLARFLQSIERNARRLDLLIQDLLSIAELESGRVRLNLQPVSLRPFVDEVLAGFQERAAARNVKLVNSLADLSVYADPDRLHQVFANLLDNAIKYGRDSGTVTVSGRLAEDGRVAIAVQDDGPGIPPEALDRVFERFYRVDKARSREQGGTGLGLAIVKHIVQTHGGNVWVRSEPGKGARFCFTLAPAK